METGTGDDRLKRTWKLYLQLFLSTFKLSAFTFGGGYVIVPLMRKRFVEELKWIDEDEMLDLVAISQSAPGPIAVNASLLVGYRMAGVPGALLTTFGTVLPPLIVITVISFFYKEFRDNVYVSRVMLGMQAGVAAVICSVVVDMGQNVLKDRQLMPVLIMPAVFVAVYFFDVNIFLVILACAGIGLAVGYGRRGRGGTGRPAGETPSDDAGLPEINPAETKPDDGKEA